MYARRKGRITATLFLLALCGVVSVSAQSIVKGDGNAGELNSLELDLLSNQLADSTATMRVVARLGDGETAKSLNHARLKSARSYLIEMRGIDSSKVVFTEGEPINGEGRLEFYLNDELMLVSLAERGKNISIGCCGDNEEDIPPSVGMPEPRISKASKLEIKIVALEKQAWEEWKNGNRKFVESFISDDAFYVYPEGVIDKPEIIGAVGSCKFNGYSLDDFRFIQLDKNAVLLSYTANQDIVCGGNPAPSVIRSTSVYVKRKGRWLSTFYTEAAVKQ